MKCLVFLAMCIGAALAGTLTLTGKHEPWSRECPDGGRLTRLQSVHLNCIEDRIWALSCSDYVTDAALPQENGEWTRDYTNYDAKFDHDCGRHAVLTGIASKYNGGAHDRAWKLRCSPIVGIELTDCSWTPWLNDYDGKLDYTVPADKAITGFESMHDNGSEDRRFKLRVCRFL